MATPRPPFYIVENFLNIKQCEQIVDDLGFYSPDVDSEGLPVKMMKHHDKSEESIFERLIPLIPNIENYFGTGYRGTEKISFEYFPTGSDGEVLCESSSWINKKWVKTRDRDLTAVVFLSDYHDGQDFDYDYEVYGGKLEFPIWDFGFNPRRGTLVVYPSSPHFINGTSRILAGDLLQARIHFASQLPYLFDPADFPGNYNTWFR